MAFEFHVKFQTIQHSNTTPSLSQFLSFCQKLRIPDHPSINGLWKASRKVVNIIKKGIGSNTVSGGTLGLQDSN